MDKIRSHAGHDRPRDDAEADLKLWSLSRIDIRSPVSAGAWPVARVELEHPSRGKVTDIAKAPGAFDAAFIAAGQILGISPALLSYSVTSAEPKPGESLKIRIDVELELDGQVYCGSSTGFDLVRCSLSAWLEAASKSLLRPEDRGGQNVRPFHVRGIDENGDLWTFATDDEDTADAIAAEFREEGYLKVQRLDPPVDSETATQI